MGNTQNKSNLHLRNHKQFAQSDRDGQAFTSQFSLSHFVGNFSGRSALSVTSNQSVYSASRPWSRVSRRRWNDSTLTNPLAASKTAWPVAYKESIFLPEFPITTDLLQREYNIQETIAKGAYGKVYKVNKNSNDNKFAIKVLSKAQIVQENAIRQVKEEARIQEVCGHHPFIVATVSRWQTKKRLYIVSEYIPCGELYNFLEKYRNIPEEVAKIFIAEISIALDFLHNAGVIYRDLKPENILLDLNYHIQLIDFGLSKWLSFGSRTNTLCGTLKYMAPEVVSRESYGHAADWWSLGVVACKILSDQFPTPAFEMKDNTEAQDRKSSLVQALLAENNSENNLKNQAGKLPDSAENLSKGARGLLMRLLERDPRVRLKNLRQIQQTAFFMGFDFDSAKKKKVSPKTLLESYYPTGPATVLEIQNENQLFSDFDQMAVN